MRCLVFVVVVMQEKGKGWKNSPRMIDKLFQHALRMIVLFHTFIT